MTKYDALTRMHASRCRLLMAANQIGELNKWEIELEYNEKNDCLSSGMPGKYLQYDH